VPAALKLSRQNQQLMDAMTNRFAVDAKNKPLSFSLGVPNIKKE
jgi:hypothetical protein